VWPDESIRHLWKQFPGGFLREQRLGFSWLFISQKGLCGLTNPFITSESNFGGYFWLRSDSVFLDCLWVKRGCVAWRIQSSPANAVSGAIFEWAATQFSLILYESIGAMWANESIHHCESTFDGYFWVGSDSVFLVCLWVNRGCVGWQIHSSPVKVISGAIFD